MRSIVVDILDTMPTNVWYLLVIGVFILILVLLVLVACIPQAGERISSFLQNVSCLWSAQSKRPKTRHSSLVRREEKELGGML